jgi:hypothetical protein
MMDSFLKKVQTTTWEAKQRLEREAKEYAKTRRKKLIEKIEEKILIAARAGHSRVRLDEEEVDCASHFSDHFRIEKTNACPWHKNQEICSRECGIPRYIITLHWDPAQSKE